MTNHHREEPLANPDRTHVIGDDPLSQGQFGEQPPEGDDELDKELAETRHPAPHNQPWRKVAREVREAVEDADGPLDRGRRGGGPASG